MASQQLALSHPPSSSAQSLASIQATPSIRSTWTRSWLQQGPPHQARPGQDLGITRISGWRRPAAHLAAVHKAVFPKALELHKHTVRFDALHDAAVHSVLLGRRVASPKASGAAAAASRPAAAWRCQRAGRVEVCAVVLRHCLH
eukprot:366441-Chlamydomonas_euryale.AAC.10